jgi:hypothetical protein
MHAGVLQIYHRVPVIQYVQLCIQDYFWTVHSARMYLHGFSPFSSTIHGHISYNIYADAYTHTRAHTYAWRTHVHIHMHDAHTAFCLVGVIALRWLLQYVCMYVCIYSASWCNCAKILLLYVCIYVCVHIHMHVYHCKLFILQLQCLGMHASNFYSPSKHSFFLACVRIFGPLIVCPHTCACVNYQAIQRSCCTRYICPRYHGYHGCMASRPRARPVI